MQTLPGPVDGAPGALVVVADDPALRFHFNAALWASYRRIGTRDGTVAQPVVGIPLSVNPHDDGHVEVELEPGLLVAEQVDAPYFSIPLRYIDWWRANKDHVGLPMGNPRPGEPRQDTERGHATVTRNAPEPTMHPSPDPSAELPAQVGQGEVIISQPDGTNWWIPTAGHRQWIADRATWRCLGGAGKTVSKDVPGAAVATLEYTGIATCEG